MGDKPMIGRGSVFQMLITVAKIEKREKLSNPTGFLSFGAI
jgi:hypothetical protein